jgi:hypothetical protein
LVDKKSLQRAMSTGSLTSITPMAPKIADINHCRQVAGRSQLFVNCREMRLHPLLPRTFQQQPDRGAGHMTGKGIAHEGRAVHEHARGALEMAVATSVVARVAASVMVPPVMALPTQRISGATPACSAANNLPVRPKPVAISSKIKSTPY